MKKRSKFGTFIELMSLANRINRMVAKNSPNRKPIGILLIVIGFLALVTPLTPGSWLIFFGLEFLGWRLAIWERIRSRFIKDDK